MAPKRRKKLQPYLAFGCSTTPIPGKGCAWRRHVGKNVQLYLAFPRQSMERVARHAGNVQLYLAFSRSTIVIFDTWRRTAVKRCNFTLRSCVRPHQSMERVARHAENFQLYLTFSRSTTPIHCNFRYVAPNGWKKMQLYLAFLRSTTPIHGKGCVSRPKNVQLYLAFSRSTTPIHCNFRYVAPNGWKKMQLYLAFVRSTTPIHGKGCEWRRHVGKMCNFILGSCVRPRQSIVIFDTSRRTLGKGCNFTLRSCV